MSNTKRLQVLFDECIIKLTTMLDNRPWLSRVLVAILLGIAVVLAVLIRTAPYRLNKIEFFEFDSYIEYWQARYIYEKGPLSWYTLTPNNPDTHIFWYPWGRDFTQTSYPFLPLWIGTTYHIVKSFGLDLYTWAALQPVIFSILATIAAYFAAKAAFNSRIAGIAASYLFATLPSAVERTVVGYVEKEGIASLFVFLFVYFYAQGVNSIVNNKRRWLLDITLASIFLALVGWLWGGYIFILGTLVLFTLLSPVITPGFFSKRLAVANLLLVVLSMIFVIPSPTNAHSLGIYPFKLRSMATIFIIASLAPLAYYYLRYEYKALGLRKPPLSGGSYIMIILIVVGVGFILGALGVLPISGRWAWALGLRIVQVDPLVESIAEHQSPLVSLATVERMLRTWGVFFSPLLFFSPLALAVIGIFYTLYTANPIRTYIGIAFALTFYSYLNAVYMVGLASYFGIFAASIMILLIVKSAFIVDAKRIDKKKIVKKRSRWSWTRIISLLVLIAVIANTAYTYTSEYSIMSNIVYTLKAGVSDVSSFSSSWYKAIEAMQATPRDSVIIAWWDYGYGISVGGGRASIADGSTINITQIGLLGLTLLARSTNEAASIARLFNVRANKTYMMIIEGILVSEQGDTIYFIPVIRGAMPGLVDWPKSVWMIRIGNYVAERLQEQGLDVNTTPTSKYLYVYRLGPESIISPRLDRPDELPLIYKLVIDGALYWAESKGKRGVFLWFTGSEQALDYTTMNLIRENLKIDITNSIVVQDPGLLPVAESRPLANDPIMTPYAIIMEPFISPATGEPISFYYLGYNVTFYSLIVIYQFNWVPE